jgi:hypothetical protein
LRLREAARSTSSEEPLKAGRFCGSDGPEPSLWEEGRWKHRPEATTGNTLERLKTQESTGLQVV